MLTSPFASDLEKLGKSPGVIGFCPMCGQPITKRSGKGRQKIFCSKVCCDRYSYQSRASRSWSGKKTKVCEYCGAEFTAYRENSYTQRYCSVMCARHAGIKQLRDQKRVEVDQGGLGEQGRAENADRVTGEL